MQIQVAFSPFLFWADALRINADSEIFHLSKYDFIFIMLLLLAIQKCTTLYAFFHTHIIGKSSIDSAT